MPPISRFNQAKPLFRQILRLHRDKEILPHPMMRSLGDTYVKKEFRMHVPTLAEGNLRPGQVSPATNEQFGHFLKQWEMYAAQLEEKQVGVKMSRAQRMSMSEEQLLKYKELRETIKATPTPGGEDDDEKTGGKL